MVQSVDFGHYTATPIPTQFLPKTLEKIVQVVFYFFVVVNLELDCAQSSDNIEILSKEIKLVEDEANFISDNTTAKGFEVVVRKFNETEDATLFSSVHMPDHILRHSGADDEGKKLVILPNDPEMKVAFKNVTTFIVLKAIGDSLHRYTTHLAYTRNFGKQFSIEWDSYSFHFHNNNDSFVQAFIPVRDGPSTLTIGLGYTLTRSRRGDEELLDDLKAKRATSSNPKISSELLEPSKLEMRDESNVDKTRLKKADSDFKDLLKLDIPYVGIGDCDFLPMKFNSPLPKDKTKLIKIFLKTLKAQCSPTILKKTLQLFDDKLVILGGVLPADITINRNNSFFKKKVLGEMEWIDFASAILLSKFSQVFTAQHNKFISGKTDNLAPDGKRISGTLRTLTLFTTRILDLLQSSEKHHAIKFANLFLVILQAQRSELTTAGDELIKCNKCREEKEVNFNDQVQLYVLMRFIVDQLPSIVSASSETEGMFNTFFLNNFVAITPYVKDKIAFVY